MRRALLSLLPAGAAAASRSLPATTTATRAIAAAAADGESGRTSTPQERIGAKAVLRGILGEEPLTKTQVWEQAEAQGLKSKRFIKQMLNQLRKAGEVKTKVLPGTANKVKKSFGYYILPKSGAGSVTSAQ